MYTSPPEPMGASYVRVGSAFFWTKFWINITTGGLPPPASSPVSFNIHEYKLIPYHYTLLTCVTVVVRTTTVLTRPQAAYALVEHNPSEDTTDSLTHSL